MHEYTLTSFSSPTNVCMKYHPGKVGQIVVISRNSGARPNARDRLISDGLKSADAFKACFGVACARETVAVGFNGVRSLYPAVYEDKHSDILNCSAPLRLHGWARRTTRFYTLLGTRLGDNQLGLKTNYLWIIQQTSICIYESTLFTHVTLSRNVYRGFVGMF
jgi:hypothetical protein